RGEKVGQWRDSLAGLGHGRTPLDVNAYLVPAALSSLADVFSHPGFPKAELLAEGARKRPGVAKALRSPPTLRARRRAGRTAARAFDVSLDGTEALARLRRYMETFSAEERRVLGTARLFSHEGTLEDVLSGTKMGALAEGVRFPGISLDARGRPLAILSSDE